MIVLILKNEKNKILKIIRRVFIKFVKWNVDWNV